MPIKLLVAGDRDVDVNVMLSTLQSQGVRVSLARAKTRTSLYAELVQAPRLDVVLACDMEDLPSVDLVEIVRVECPFVPVVVVTRRPGVEQAVMAMRMGASDYLRQDRLERLGHVIMREARRNRGRRRQEADDETRDGYFRAMLMALPQLIIRFDAQGDVVDVLGGRETKWRPKMGKNLASQLGGFNLETEEPIVKLMTKGHIMWLTRLDNGEGIVILERRR
ncbi:MAG: hypothetical protein AAGA48_40915 [Myxococcota bacterium]